MEGRALRNGPIKMSEVLVMWMRKRLDNSKQNTEKPWTGMPQDMD
jgi:hypothetical protein